MSDLKQQLEAVCDRMADYYVDETMCGADIDEQQHHDGFKAGFNAAIPIILKAVEQRNEFGLENKYVEFIKENQELINLLVDGGK